MVLNTLKNSVKELEDALINAAYHNADLTKKPDTLRLSLKNKKVDSYKNTIVRNTTLIRKKMWELAKLGSEEPNQSHVLSLLNLSEDLGIAYSNKDTKQMLNLLNQIGKELNQVKEAPVAQQLDFRIPNLHPDIKEEVLADLKELSKCYQAECYRSAVIICGRILETILHRKYYEITGNDALEKSPGIGLGNLIAKLTEKNVKFDPGLTQQIHLINQVRISSVHKKQEPFYPTQMQAHAIILFTLDSVRKMF
ncbi:hypothetical protein FJZ53_01955 [Candidatus Woesearchaeota archaeon]|nr:hypothetical protein [Candidatus Woesearchaeota archaeon]